VAINVAKALFYCPRHDVPLLLGAQMKLNFPLEEQLSQNAVRGLAHGFGLHAHLVLVCRELVCAVLLVPQVEKPSRRRADHHQLAVKVLPVQVHVLQPPTFDVTVKTTCQEVETFSCSLSQSSPHLPSALTRHP